MMQMMGSQHQGNLMTLQLKIKLTRTGNIRVENTQTEENLQTEDITPMRKYTE